MRSKKFPLHLYMSDTFMVREEVKKSKLQDIYVSRMNDLRSKPKVE